MADELAAEVRTALGIELRTDAYREMFKFHKLRVEANLTDVLERHNVAFAKSDKADALVERVECVRRGIVISDSTAS